MNASEPLVPEDPRDILVFEENGAVFNTVNLYQVIDIDVLKALESWKSSLFSYEWITKDGFKPLDRLAAREREKRLIVERKIEARQALEMPILGMGVLENVEIGSGRAVFLTLALHGARVIPVHIPSSQADYFRQYLRKTSPA